MGFRISTNIPSLSAQRSLNTTREAQHRSQAKLATGERIVRAADDAAGLSISEKMKAEIRSNAQATRNASDAISLIQTAEGGFNEIQNILIRLRELSMQAANDTYGDVERAFADKEAQGILTELERISHTTRFNQTQLLDGTSGLLEFQVGTHNNAEQDRLTYDAGSMNVTTEKLKLQGLNVASKVAAQENLARIDDAIQNVNGQRAELGAMQNRLSSTINTLMIMRENQSASNSRIRDVDVASESSELVKRNILIDSGASMLAQANSNGMLALKLLG